MKRFPSFMLWVALGGAPVLACAHAHLAQSDPANDATLTTILDHFTLTFSESTHLTALTLQKDGDGAPQRIVGLPKTASERFSIAAPKLTAGVYTLRFRNVAIADNHITAGTIKFTIAATARPAAPGNR